MPQITFNIKSKVDVNQILSAKDLRSTFLSGLDLTKLGMISDDTYDFYINAAQDYVEQKLTIKLNKQIINENKDFRSNDWATWGHMKMTYPAVYGLSLQGFLGDVLQTTYPSSWLSCRVTSDGRLYSRDIFLVPTQNSTQNELVLVSGIMSNQGFFYAQAMIPDYWNVSYVTGFDDIPKTIVNAIGMLAAIPILMLLSDLIIQGNRNLPGIGFGVSTSSISLDSLSQNQGTYLNGNNTIFGARIKQMTEQLYGNGKGNGGMINDLYDYYGQFIWTSL